MKLPNLKSFGGKYNGLLLGALVGGAAIWAYDHYFNRPTPSPMPHHGRRHYTPDIEQSMGDSGGTKTHYTPDIDAAQSLGMYEANVGFLPGNRLPFNDYLDDRYVTSEVWDRRTSVYKNDGVIYNTTPAFFPGPTTDFHPEHRLDVAGAYTPHQEDGPRPLQQHAGGVFPNCLRAGSNASC